MGKTTMNNHALQPLPLGTSDFRALRDVGQIYVDKTALVYEIASKQEKILISRPRRFGKTLLLSTFESLFKYGLRDFKGLDIEHLWKDTKSYKVVRLDFSEVKPTLGFQRFQKDLSDRLVGNFSSVGFKLNNSGSSVFSQLSDWLKTVAENSLVILIDEYDAPLTACLNDQSLFEMVRAELSNFYSVIKSNDAAIRFFFMTGITKFNKTSIFSELNNFSDLTLHPKYGTLLGYTHEEVEKYFDGYLNRAAEVLGIDRSKLLADLTEHYDGFCFDRRASVRVFVPWSLLKFFDSPEEGYLDYWFESGGKPSALTQYLKTHSLRNPEEYAQEKSISLSNLSGSSDTENLSDIGLLTQAGYLTIKSIEYGDTVFVDYPNAEVRRAMAQLYTEQLLSGKSAGQVGAGPIVRVLSTEGAEALYHILNRLFASIDYQQYPIKNEHSVRAFTQVYMAGAGLEPKIEVHNHKGRSDLEVAIANRHWVLEFKFCREGEEACKQLQEALEQIQTQHYGEQSETEELIRVALVFSEKERQFVKWKAP